MTENPPNKRKSPVDYAIPAFETAEGKERERAYYEALGRFVDMFARVESTVTITLWSYAGTKPEIAKIAFAGTRVDVGCTYIKQLAETTGAPQDVLNDLKDVLQQIGIINGVRNAILHYGATSVAEGRAIVSDALKAKGQPTEFPISPTALDDMTVDLHKIIVHLGYRHLKRPAPLGQFGRDVLSALLNAPWRYKHPVPTQSKTKQGEPPLHRKRGAEPLRQQQSSQRKRK